VALKSFSATRAPQAGDSKRLGYWSLSAGGTALVVRLCDGTSATPLIEIQVPINSSASQAYAAPNLPIFPNRLHVEVVSGVLNRGCVDLQ
jgi:hypothetical protein